MNYTQFPDGNHCFCKRGVSVCRNFARTKTKDRAAAFCILFIRLAVVNTFFKQGGIADGKDNFG